ncbi:MAG: lysophospholipid acyltransferase family protein [Gemmatimonadota bacterium]
MRLHRFFPRVSRLALGVYYRFERAGATVPERGPVLVVANHPNSLLDPAAVCAVARRPVRFLAKAPLFSEPGLGWIMRACGAIPVYRRQDNPTLMHRNDEAFRAAHETLAGGSAVGIFPEGTSHSEPALVPLKTGAARIALGAARLRRCGFPIVPVGLVLRHKERFRSRALVVVGEPVPWGDLAGAGPEEEEAVRELTGRIERALREVTLNLESWEDAPVVECVEAIYAAELELPRDRAERVRRLGRVSEALVRLRRSQPERLAPLYRLVARYADLLAQLGLRPHRVGSAPPPAAVFGWTVRQVAFFVLLAPLAAAGHLLFFLPYRITGLLPRRAGVERDVQSTYKVLGGILVYGTWILLLATLAGWRLGTWAGLLTALLLPALAFLTLVVRDRWTGARANARSYLLLRGRAQLQRRLLERRRELAERLEALRRELDGSG